MPGVHACKGCWSLPAGASGGWMVVTTWFCACPSGPRATTAVRHALAIGSWWFCSRHSPRCLLMFAATAVVTTDTPLATHNPTRPSLPPLLPPTPHVCMTPTRWPQPTSHAVAKTTVNALHKPHASSSCLPHTCPHNLLQHHSHTARGSHHQTSLAETLPGTQPQRQCAAHEEACPPLLLPGNMLRAQKTVPALPTQHPPTG